MKYFKKGQTVYDIELGKGVVESIQKSTFPITVKFWTNAYSYYTLNGIRNGNENITLFNHLPEVNNKPIWEPKEGDLIYIEPYKGSTIYEEILRKVLKVDRVLLDSWNGPEVIVIYHRMEYRVLISHIRLAKPTDFSSYKLQDYQNFILDSFYSI